MPNMYTRAWSRWLPTGYLNRKGSALREGYLCLPVLNTSSCPFFFLVPQGFFFFYSRFLAIVHGKHTGVLYPHPHTREQQWMMMRKWEGLPEHSATLLIHEPHVAHVNNDQKPTSLHKIAHILIALLEVYKCNPLKCLYGQLGFLGTENRRTPW